MGGGGRLCLVRAKVNPPRGETSANTRQANRQHVVHFAFLYARPVNIDILESECEEEIYKDFDCVRP